MCLALGFPRSAFNRHTALVVGYLCCSALECSPAARWVVGTYARIADPCCRLGLVVHWLGAPVLVLVLLATPSGSFARFGQHLVRLGPSVAYL